eukprot:3304511-Rhodomonas_salina.1
MSNKEGNFTGSRSINDKENVKVLDKKLDLVLRDEKKVEVLNRELDLVVGYEEKANVLDKPEKLNLV